MEITLLHSSTGSQQRFLCTWYLIKGSQAHKQSRKLLCCPPQHLHHSDQVKGSKKKKEKSQVVQMKREPKSWDHTKARPGTSWDGNRLEHTRAEQHCMREQTGRQMENCVWWSWKRNCNLPHTPGFALHHEKGRQAKDTDCNREGSLKGQDSNGDILDFGELN